MPFATTNYGWTLPDAGAEPFSWEPFVRTAFQGIDTTMFSKFDKAGGTITGSVTVAGDITAGNIGIGGAAPSAPLVVRAATDSNIWMRAGADTASGLTGAAISGINNAASSLC